MSHEPSTMNTPTKPLLLAFILVIVSCSQSKPASSQTEAATAPQADSQKTVVAAASTACPTDVFLDVSKFDGPGPGYPAPQLEVSCTSDSLIIRSNGIPHYEFVPITPNPLRARTVEHRLPRQPKLADRTTQIPRLGTVAVAVNGIAIFGPNEGPRPSFEAFGDPIYNSIMDSCMGHTADVYHYHALLVQCLSNSPVPKGKPSPIIGYAFDGFPIYGPYGCLDAACKQVVEFKSSWERTGNPQTNAWDAHRYVSNKSAVHLDQCNGRIGPDGTYRYHATFTFPYILGCYRGVVSAALLNNGPGNRPGGQPGGQPGATGAGNLRDRPGGQPGRQPGRQPGATGAGNPRDRSGQSGRPGPGGHPDLAAAARRLGMSEQSLRNALGPPPPDLTAAARRLNISEQALRNALGVPNNGQRPGEGQAAPGRVGQPRQNRPEYDLDRPGNIIQLGSNRGTPSGTRRPGRSDTDDRPNLAAAAARLGISEQQLRDALGPPPPDLTAAAQRLGISVQVLRNVLGTPPASRGSNPNPALGNSGAVPQNAGCSLTPAGEVMCQ